MADLRKGLYSKVEHRESPNQQPTPVWGSATHSGEEKNSHRGKTRNRGEIPVIRNSGEETQNGKGNNDNELVITESHGLDTMIQFTNPGNANVSGSIKSQENGNIAALSGNRMGAMEKEAGTCATVENLNLNS